MGFQDEFNEPLPLKEKREEYGISLPSLYLEAKNFFGREPNKSDLVKYEILKIGFPICLNKETYLVKYKKYFGKYILSCSCPAWIYNISKNRTCKHTFAVQNFLRLYGIEPEFEIPE